MTKLSSSRLNQLRALMRCRKYPAWQVQEGATKQEKQNRNQVSMFYQQKTMLLLPQPPQTIPSAYKHSFNPILTDCQVHFDFQWLVFLLGTFLGTEHLGKMTNTNSLFSCANFPVHFYWERLVRYVVFFCDLMNHWDAYNNLLVTLVTMKSELNKEKTFNRYNAFMFQTKTRQAQ